MIKYLWAGVAVVVGIILMSTVGSAAAKTALPGEATHPAGGTFTFYALERLDIQDYKLDQGEECQGNGGFNDIREYADVKVRTGKGEIVAAGAMGPGTYDTVKGCLFFITVENVPRWQGTYTWEVAHRGELTVSEADAIAGVASGILRSN